MVLNKTLAIFFSTRLNSFSMLTSCSSFRVGLLNDLETNDLRSLITEDDTISGVKNTHLVNY